jgi:hypothetical protein
MECDANRHPLFLRFFAWCSQEPFYRSLLSKILDIYMYSHITFHFFNELCIIIYYRWHLVGLLPKYIDIGSLIRVNGSCIKPLYKEKVVGVYITRIVIWGWSRPWAWGLERIDRASWSRLINSNIRITQVAVIEDDGDDPRILLRSGDRKDRPQESQLRL